MALIITGLIASIVLAVISAVLIKRKDWEPRKKKWVFSFLAAFLICPVFVPAGTIAAIPLPNAAVLVMSMSDPVGILEWYVKTWFLTLPSFVVSALLMRGIAAMIYFQRPDNPQ